MPTISEPIDNEMRLGRAQALVENYIRDEIGEDTLRCSLAILKFDPYQVKQVIWTAQIKRLERWGR